MKFSILFIKIKFFYGFRIKVHLSPNNFPQNLVENIKNNQSYIYFSKSQFFCFFVTKIFLITKKQNL